MKVVPSFRKGFTLMELLLYVSVSSAILLAIVFSVFLVLEARVKQQVVAEVNQQGVQVMQLITQTIRNADSVQVPGFGGASSTLSLETLDATKNPTYFYASTSSVLYVREGTSTPIELTNSRVTVQNLLFENISSIGSTQGIIQVSFSLRYATSTTRNEYSYTKTFSGSASFIQ